MPALILLLAITITIAQNANAGDPEILNQTFAGQKCEKSFAPVPVETPEKPQLVRCFARYELDGFEFGDQSHAFSLAPGDAEAKELDRGVTYQTGYKKDPGISNFTIDLGRLDIVDGRWWRVFTLKGTDNKEVLPIVDFFVDPSYTEQGSGPAKLSFVTIKAAKLRQDKESLPLEYRFSSLPYPNRYVYLQSLELEIKIVAGAASSSRAIPVGEGIEYLKLDCQVE
ncbi:MAG: hypothetical protein HY401_05915 [Elusimicrobia bacterium]|nr:hypothetical protein [Elusimicrobiota bacterium]